MTSGFLGDQAAAGFYRRLRDRVSLLGIGLALAACSFDLGGGGGTNGQPRSSGCGSGGLNDNVKTPGNESGGVKLAIGDIAVAPDGSYVVFTHGAELGVGWTATGAVALLPVSHPGRLVFSRKRPVIYVSSTVDGALHALHVGSGVELWKAPAYGLDRVEVTKDDSLVAFTAGNHLNVVDAADGTLVRQHALGLPAVDLEILPGDKRALVVEQHQWLPDGESPMTVVRVVDLDQGAERSFEVPNCSDDAVVANHGTTALLAPTTCQRDPISVLDLSPGHEGFTKNLPGFGPVAVAPDGVTAVGFFSRADADLALFDDPADVPGGSNYHLMVIDSTSGAYQFYDYGESMPRYALTPNGNVLLVDHDVSGSARLFDLGSRTFHTIAGPALSFDQLVMTSDSHHAYVLSDTDDYDYLVGHQLFELDIPAAVAAPIDPGFAPLNFNISPDDRALFLRRDSYSICIFSLETRRCDASFESEPGLI